MGGIVLNIGGAACASDVICDFPLKKMLAYHKAKGAEGTILVTQARPHAF